MAHTLPDAVYRQVFEQAPSACLLLNPHFEIMAASDLFLHTVSRRFDEIEGMTPFDAFPENPDDPLAAGFNNWRQSLAAVLRTRRTHTMATRRFFVPMPGENAPMETHYQTASNTPIFDEHGEVEWILHRFEDLAAGTESSRSSREWEQVAKGLEGRAEIMEAQIIRQADQATVLAKEKVSDRASEVAKELVLREQAELEFSRLLEIAPDAMVIVDIEGTVVLLNSKAEHLFGYSREQMLGKSLDLLFPDGYRNTHANDVAKMFGSTQDLTTPGVIELLGRRQDGSTFPFGVTLSPLETLAGTLRIIAIRDLTERRKLDLQLIRTQRLESIGTFAGKIAHDLNNAIAPIMMSLELLKLESPNESDLIGAIESGANRGAEMLRQLLVFSKGSFVEPKPVSPLKVVQDIAALVEGTFPDNIQVHESFAPGLLPLLGDATQIHQVLFNLCINARDAMPEGGVLTIQAENVTIDASYASHIESAEPGSYVMFKVSDTGTGISEAVIDRIFEPFFTTKGLGKGTGLGLSIVLGIVKSHGGFVNAYSTPGKGSTFAIYLPVDDPDLVVGDDPIAISTPLIGHGESILVVDDSDSMLSVVRSVLTALNFEVISAPDGKHALELVSEHGKTIVAVITDVHMPFMDGLEFVTRLRRVLPDVGIIVDSGNLDEEDAKQFMKMGVRTFLEKPFTQNQLTLALRSVL